MHNGYPLGVDGEEVGVFKEVDKESLGGFLEGLNGLGLPAEFVVHGAAGDGYFADQSRKWKLEQEEIGV